MTDYLVRKRKGKRAERVPILDYHDVYVFKAKPKAKSSLGSFLRSPGFVSNSAKKAVPNAQPRGFMAKLQGDLWWNTSIDLEEQEDATACAEAVGVIEKYDQCESKAKRQRVAR